MGLPLFVLCGLFSAIKVMVPVRAGRSARCGGSKTVCPSRCWWFRCRNGAVGVVHLFVEDWSGFGLIACMALHTCSQQAWSSGSWLCGWYGVLLCSIAYGSAQSKHAWIGDDRMFLCNDWVTPHGI